MAQITGDIGVLKRLQRCECGCGVQVSDGTGKRRGIYVGFGEKKIAENMESKARGSWSDREHKPPVRMHR